MVTYGPGGRFCMTDRGREAVTATKTRFAVGPSSMRWENGQLLIDVDERGSLPQLGRIRGEIAITPSAVTDVELPLTPGGEHVWRPFAPTSRASVDLEAHGWQWEGHGYFDANFGSRPLEADFRYWNWARYPDGDGTLCVYDAERRDGGRLDAAVAFGPDGAARAAAAPPRTPFARSAWRVRRETRSDPGTVARQVRPMLDAPFYCRSEVETQIDGRRLRGVHEALDLDRFDTTLVKGMLAVRVPRRARWP